MDIYSGTGSSFPTLLTTLGSRAVVPARSPLEGNELWVSNEAPTDINVSSTTFLEDISIGNEVGLLSSIDADTGEVFTYSLVAGLGDTDNTLFSITGNSLKVATAIDFETKSSYSIRVRSTDRWGSSFDKSIALTVADVNEPVVLKRDNAIVSGIVLSTLTNTGTWSDPELGNITLTASLGTIVKNANGTWNWAYTPTAKLVNQSVTVTANDGTNTSSVSFAINANVAISQRGLFYNGATGASGGADVLTGGQSNDILAISDLTFKRIIGGTGSDTLRLDGSGLHHDLIAIRDNRIVDIETIDITGSGNNTLTVNQGEVLNLSSSSNTLLVRRNVGDTVNMGSGWTQGAAETIGPDTFDVFTQGQAILKVQRLTAATIAARHIFFNNATGANLSSEGAANNAFASDKSPLLSGSASTFANYTNYSRGLNGIIVDVNNLPAATTDGQILASLQFARWNGIDAGGFSALPGAAIPTATILSASGSGGSARVKITFPDNTLQNTWLRVTVLANADTALATNDVFYFGNVIGDFDVGNTTTRIRVNALDTSAVRNNQSTGANSAAVTNVFDVNRDARVNALDASIVRNNQQTSGIVAPITAPSTFGRQASGAWDGEGEANQGIGEMPSILSSRPSATRVTVVDSFPTVGPRWTGESYDVIHIALNSDKSLLENGDVVSRNTSNDESRMKEKRMKYDVLPYQVDGYFASLESELDHVCDI